MARREGMEGGIAGPSPSYPTMRTLGQKQKESFGNGSNIKIPIDATMIGLIIGKRGRNSKRICSETGLGYLTVAYTTLDSNSNRPRQNVLIMEGSLESILAAVHIVRQMFDPEDIQQSPTHDGIERLRHKKYKTKLCWRFSRGGVCPYAKLCQFAHGEEEIIK